MRKFIPFLVMLGLSCQPLIATAADSQGPIISSVTLSPTSVDVTTSSAAIRVDITLSDSDGVLHMEGAWASNNWGRLQSADCGYNTMAGWLQLTASSPTTVSLRGVIVVEQQSMPVSCSISAIFFARDRFNNQYSGGTAPIATLTIQNSAGLPPQGLAPPLPSGTTLQDLVPPENFRGFSELEAAMDKLAEQLRLAVASGALDGAAASKILARRSSFVPHTQDFMSAPFATYMTNSASLIASATAQLKIAERAKIITCVKGKQKKVIKGPAPRCPAGWKRA